MSMSMREALERAQNAQRAINELTGKPTTKPTSQPETMLPFGTVLLLARTEAGMSQSRLADRAGYEHSYISRLESDSRSPTRDAVLNFAAALGCDDEMRDRLLMSAGYLPLDLVNVFWFDPDLQALIRRVSVA